MNLRSDFKHVYQVLVWSLGLFLAGLAALSVGANSAKAAFSFPSPNEPCVRAGCSNELCVTSSLAGQIMSPCIFQEETSCYQTARCERQTSGSCGFTQTPELLACLGEVTNSSPGNPGPAATPLPPGCYYQQVQCVTFPCLPVLVCPDGVSVPAPSPSPSPIANSDSSPQDCVQRPACLDANPPCMVMERSDWCPPASPSPGASPQPTVAPSPVGGPITICPGGTPVCTQDVRQCPDGGYVSRTGCNCEFAACPGTGSGDSGGGDSTGGNFHPADLNRDGRVNLLDFSLLVQAMRRGSVISNLGYNPDLNGDGRINLLDLTILIKAFRSGS